LEEAKPTNLAIDFEKKVSAIDGRSVLRHVDV
jgi:hypothetical protein